LPRVSENAPQLVGRAASARPSRHGGFNRWQRTDERSAPRAGGGWQITGGATGGAGGAFRTQAEAERAARQELLTSGGGELVVKGRDGKVRSQNTIGRSDPRGTKG
jgi:hypothetical protein